MNDHHCLTCAAEHIGRFLPRGSCGEWAALEQLLYQWGHLMTMSAYLAIPLVLVSGILSKIDARDIGATERDIARGVYAAFILICGIGHLEGFISFYWPRYDVFAYWQAITATVSWAAVYVTYRIRHTLAIGI